MGDFERKLKLADIRVGLMDLIIRRDQADSAKSAYMAALPPELKLLAFRHTTAGIPKGGTHVR